MSWVLHRDDILAPDNAELLKCLTENPNKAKMGKGAALISMWRKLLQQASNVSGLRPLFEAATFERWRAIETNAFSCFEFSAALLTVVCEISQIRNKPQRIAAAKKYQTSKGSFDFGSTLGERLSLLISGAWPAKAWPDE